MIPAGRVKSLAFIYKKLEKVIKVVKLTIIRKEKPKKGRGRLDKKRRGPDVTL
jgi:hypothetical protein